MFSSQAQHKLEDLHAGLINIDGTRCLSVVAERGLVLNSLDGISTSLPGCRHVIPTLALDIIKKAKDVSLARSELGALSARYYDTSMLSLQNNEVEDELVTKYLDLKEISERKLKFAYFLDWRCSYKSNQVKCFLRLNLLNLCFLSWRAKQNSLGGTDSPSKPHRVRSYMKKVYGDVFKSLLHNVERRKTEKKLQLMATDSAMIKRRSYKLKLSIFHAWLQVVRISKGGSLLNEEHLDRKERIARFVDNLRCSNTNNIAADSKDTTPQRADTKGTYKQIGTRVKRENERTPGINVRERVMNGRPSLSARHVKSESKSKASMVIDHDVIYLASPTRRDRIYEMAYEKDVDERDESDEMESPPPYHVAIETSNKASTAIPTNRQTLGEDEVYVSF